MKYDDIIFKNKFYFDVKFCSNVNSQMTIILSNFQIKKFNA